MRNRYQTAMDKLELSPAAMERIRAGLRPRKPFFLRSRFLSLSCTAAACLLCVFCLHHFQRLTADELDVPVASAPVQTTAEPAPSGPSPSSGIPGLVPGASEKPGPTEAPVATGHPGGTTRTAPPAKTKAPGGAATQAPAISARPTEAPIVETPPSETGQRPQVTPPPDTATPPPDTAPPAEPSAPPVLGGSDFMKEFASAAELTASTPFSCVIPELSGYSPKRFVLYLDTFIEVIYQGADQQLTYRMGPGSGDISGDYRTYDSQQEQALGAYTVRLYRSGGILQKLWVTDGTSVYTLCGDSLEGLLPQLP